MGKLIVTGDTHNDIDIRKINTKNFPYQKELTKEDIMVVLGDWGAIWHGNNKDNYLLCQWENRNWTTFVVLGNHENYSAIEKLPIIEKFGGRVYQAAPSIFLAVSGEIYNLNGQSCLVINGADSVDVYNEDGSFYRKPFVSWWPQEQIDEKAYKNALRNLERVNFSVDFVFTHTGGTNVSSFLGFKPTFSDIKLQEILDRTIYREHLCGHYHLDKLTPTCRIVYNDIKLIADSKKEYIF